MREAGILDNPITAYAAAPASHPLDIICRVRQRMASRSYHQVALLLPGADIPALRATQSVQPTGCFGRREIPLEVSRKVGAKAADALHGGSTSAEAHEEQVRNRRAGMPRKVGG